jgi:hypothetical protein
MDCTHIQFEEQDDPVPGVSRYTHQIIVVCSPKQGKPQPPLSAHRNGSAERAGGWPCTPLTFFTFMRNEILKDEFWNIDYGNIFLQTDLRSDVNQIEWGESIFRCVLSIFQTKYLVCYLLDGVTCAIVFVHDSLLMNLLTQFFLSN